MIECKLRMFNLSVGSRTEVASLVYRMAPETKINKDE